MNQRKKKILAIDPSLTATGYSFGIKEGQFGVLCIKTKDLENTGEALSKIDQFFSKLIEEEDIDICFREGYAFGFRNNGVTKLIEVGGVLKKLCFEKGIPYIDIPPKTIKKIITGFGDANKKYVISRVNELLDLEVKDDNAADALAIYLVGKGYLRYLDKNNIDEAKISNVKDFIEEEMKTWVAENVDKDQA